MICIIRSGRQRKYLPRWRLVPHWVFFKRLLARRSNKDVMPRVWCGERDLIWCYAYCVAILLVDFANIVHQIPSQKRDYVRQTGQGP